jgi:hypothetical protein
MSEDPVADAARAAAEELAPQLGRPQLAMDVEAALYARGDGGQQRPAQYVDPVALGGLIVAVATLAWQVYRDLRKDGTRPGHDTLTRIVRFRRREISDVDGTEQKVIEVIAAEIIRADHDGE